MVLNFFFLQRFVINIPHVLNFYTNLKYFVVYFSSIILIWKSGDTQPYMHLHVYLLDLLKGFDIFYTRVRNSHGSIFNFR